MTRSRLLVRRRFHAQLRSRCSCLSPFRQIRDRGVGYTRRIHRTRRFDG